MATFRDRTGERHFSNQGEMCEIIKYINNKCVTIQFKDGTIVEALPYNDIKNGKIKNPNKGVVFNIGFIGQGKYTSTIEGKKTKYYDCWYNMLTRGYDEKYKQKQPTYKEVTVCKEWHNFQNFAKWHEENYREDYELDKDILIKGSKIYSPKTCAFVPAEINMLFVKSNSKRGNLPIGVHKDKNGFQAGLNKEGDSIYIGYFNTPQEAFQAYKTVKEDYIKEVADLWKNKIAEPIYTALINYQVEITD